MRKYGIYFILYRLESLDKSCKVFLDETNILILLRTVLNQRSKSCVRLNAQPEIQFLN